MGSSAHMSTALASTAGIAIYALALLPVIWIALRGDSLPALVALGAFLSALAVYHTGIFHRSSLASIDVMPRTATPDYDAQCRAILDTAGELGLRADRSDPAAPKVVGNGVDQLPREVREVLLECFEREDRATNPGEPSETEDGLGQEG